jgi:hypothetical protein
MLSMVYKDKIEKVFQKWHTLADRASLKKKTKYSSHAVLCIIFKSGKECTRREDYTIG